MKKILSIALAILMLMTISTIGFATEPEKYDYANAEWYINATKNEGASNGDFTWGAASKCYYQISTGKTYAQSETTGVVVEPDGTVRDLVDTLSPIYIDCECVTLDAFYAFVCPRCNQAVGAYSLVDLYNKNSGSCANCMKNVEKALTAVDKELIKGQIDDTQAQEKKEEINSRDVSLPDPTTVKVYRFIVVQSSSAHYLTYKDANMANLRNSIFNETAGLYGDGKDLPQQFINFEEKSTSTFNGFKTSGIVTPTSDYIGGKLAETFTFFLSYLKYNVVTVAISNLFENSFLGILDLLNGLGVTHK